MSKAFFTWLSVSSAFTLGLYAASQLKFDTPVEIHKWLIASFLFMFFTASAYYTKTNDAS